MSGSGCVAGVWSNLDPALLPSVWGFLWRVMVLQGDLALLVTLVIDPTHHSSTCLSKSD